jgi:hypothetical protein
MAAKTAAVLVAVSGVALYATLSGNADILSGFSEHNSLGPIGMQVALTVLFVFATFCCHLLAFTCLLFSLLFAVPPIRFLYIFVRSPDFEFIPRLFFSLCFLPHVLTS